MQSKVNGNRTARCVDVMAEAALGSWPGCVREKVRPCLSQAHRTFLSRSLRPQSRLPSCTACFLPSFPLHLDTVHRHIYFFILFLQPQLIFSSHIHLLLFFNLQSATMCWPFSDVTLEDDPDEYYHRRGKGMYQYDWNGQQWTLKQTSAIVSAVILSILCSFSPILNFVLFSFPLSGCLYFPPS